MCRSCGGTLAVSGSNIEGAMRYADVYGRPWRVHTQATIALRGGQESPIGQGRRPRCPARCSTCPVAALCVLRPASAWGVLLRQNPTASEISDARFRAIYSGMRKLPPGSVLNKTASSTAGTCIPECTGRYAENCADGQCTAVLGDSKYCSRCKNGYAPIDRMCTNVATTRRDASVCTASGGVCTACTGTYALLSGGCHDTQALPGMAVCTAATSGSCTTCANGQNANSGVCPACAEGCSACNAGQTQQCTKCLAGYYSTALLRTARSALRIATVSPASPTA